MSTQNATQNYVPYRDDLETIQPDEPQTIASLIDTLRTISETTYKDGGHALRSVHVKSHALLRGELVIPEGLPLALQQGLFAKPGRHSVVMRLSTSPGDLLPDTVSTPRGLAIKVLDVDGERLPGADGTTQDFVMVNGPAFKDATAKDFLGGLKLLAKTTDKAGGFKEFASAIFRGTEKTIEALGGESASLKAMGGHPLTHPLGETFYTQVPIRFGDYVAKLSVAPVSPELLALKDRPVDMHDRPDALREVCSEFFARHGAQWEVRVQLCTDTKTMPIEDASVVWPEDESPYLPVGRITVTAQPSWTADRAKVVDDALAFSPWHGITAHRPLGSIMRARKPAYESSFRFRARHNGCPMQEPDAQQVARIAG